VSTLCSVTSRHVGYAKDATTVSTRQTTLVIACDLALRIGVASGRCGPIRAGGGGGNGTSATSTETGATVFQPHRAGGANNRGLSCAGPSPDAVATGGAPQPAGVTRGGRLPPGTPRYRRG